MVPVALSEYDMLIYVPAGQRVRAEELRVTTASGDLHRDIAEYLQIADAAATAHEHSFADGKTRSREDSAAAHAAKEGGVQEKLASAQRDYDTSDAANLGGMAAWVFPVPVSAPSPGQNCALLCDLDKDDSHSGWLTRRRR